MPGAHRKRIGLIITWRPFYCDLEAIPALCAQLCNGYPMNDSIGSALHRQDYLPSSRTLRDEVIHQIKEKTGVTFNGQIALLANWRSFGTLMNPHCIVLLL